MFNSSYRLFTFIGILASIAQVILTFYVLYKYILKSNTWKKLEYQLIMFRVFLDALIGVGGLAYFLSTLPMIFSSEQVSFNVPFIIGVLNLNLFDMRSFLASIIAIERVLAVAIPLGFFKYRKKVSNYPIFAFIVSTGIAGFIALFGVCDSRFPLNPACTLVGCATPSCYRSYAFAVKSIYSSTNVCFSLLLCYKLFLIYWKRTQVTADIRRLNWLSLTDGVSTLVFELLPSLVINVANIDVREFGPMLSALRHVSRAVEVAVMVKLMKKIKPVVATTVSIASVRINGP